MRCSDAIPSTLFGSLHDTLTEGAEICKDLVKSKLGPTADSVLCVLHALPKYWVDACMWLIRILIRICSLWQIYEGGSLSALLVDGTPGCSAFRLCEIQVLVEPGHHSLLEQDRARLLYVIQNGDSSGVSGFGAAIRVVMRSDDAPQASMVAKDVCDGSVIDSETGKFQELLWGATNGATTIGLLSTEQESGVCRWVAYLCKEEIRAVEVLEVLSAREDDQESCSPGEPQSWMRRKHVCLAKTYCRQRAELLQRVVMDLEAQLNLLQDCG